MAEMTVINPFDFFLEPDAEHVPVRYDELQRRSWRRSSTSARRARVCRHSSPRFDRDADPHVDFLVDLNQRLQSEVRYLIRMEPGVQTSEETLELRQRLVPRLGLAAGGDAAPPRARRALRLGLPDPARSPT